MKNSEAKAEIRRKRIIYQEQQEQDLVIHPTENMQKQANLITPFPREKEKRATR